MLKVLTSASSAEDHKVKKQTSAVRDAVLFSCPFRVDNMLVFLEIPVIAFAPGACPAFQRVQRQLTQIWTASYFLPLKATVLPQKRANSFLLPCALCLSRAFSLSVPHEITNVAQFCTTIFLFLSARRQRFGSLSIYVRSSKFFIIIA